MPVTEPLSDEALAEVRENMRLGIENRRLVRALMATIDQRDEALRAALVAQPQPLFEGTWRDLLRQGVSTSELSQRVVVYPAVTGSATPTTRGDGCSLCGRYGVAFELRGHKWDCEAVAGSATPTGDDVMTWRQFLDGPTKAAERIRAEAHRKLCPSMEDGTPLTCEFPAGHDGPHSFDPQPLCGTCGQPLENGMCFRYHPEAVAGSATPTTEDHNDRPRPV